MSIQFLNRVRSSHSVVKYWGFVDATEYLGTSETRQEKWNKTPCYYLG